MDNFVRGQSTGTDEKKGNLGAIRDQKIPIQKTQSFKGNVCYLFPLTFISHKLCLPFSAEKKRGQNWFQKQLPMKRSHDFDSFEIEHAAAVAAAAFSINLQEASEQTSETPETSLDKTKSKLGSSKSSKSLLASASKRLSGKNEHVALYILTNNYLPLLREKNQTNLLNFASIVFRLI